LIIEASINEFLRDDIVNSLTNIYINWKRLKIFNYLKNIK
jgi:hypothetical protein